MSFIYYKRSKKEKLQFQRKISKVGAHEVIFAHHAKIWHTLRKFGTPCQNLAHLAKIWHTLPNFGTPCEIDVFALRNALFSSILLLKALATPFQVCQGVLKCSKARFLHVLQTLSQSWLVSVIQKATKNTQTYQKLVSNICQVLNMPIGIKGLITTQKCLIQLSLSL